MAKPFESHIQDLVYNVEAGVGLRMIKTGLFLLCVVGIATLYAKEFKSFRTAEAMEYAQLARNFSWKLPPAEAPGIPRSRLVTQVIRPVSLWYLIENSDYPIEDSQYPDSIINRHPDILHPPVYPMVLGTLFDLVDPEWEYDGGREGKYKPEQHIVVPFGLFLTLLTGLFVYLLAHRLFDRRTALLGVTIFFLSNAVWDHAISGLPITLTLLFTVLTFYFATIAVTHRRAAAPPARWLIPLGAASVCCVLAALTQYPAIALLPGVMLYVGAGFRGKASMWSLVILVVFIAGMAPWLMRNKSVSGSYFGLAPYEALKDTYTYPENTFDRKLAPNLKEDGDKIIKGLQNKVAVNLARNYSTLFHFGAGPIAALFIATFLFSFMNPATQMLRWGAALTLGFVFLATGFFGESAAQVFHVLWPVAVIYGSGFFFLLLDRLQFNIKLINMLITTAIIVLCAIPTILTLLPPRSDVPYPPYYAPFVYQITRLFQPDELLCTDMPWATAWYGQTNSVLLPNSIDEFYNINDYIRRVNGIYFTTITRDKKYVTGLINGSERTWFPILQGRNPSGFPLTVKYPIHKLEQLLVTDRPRWSDE